MLRIAIDIDGVIVDTEKYILEKGPLYYKKEPKRLTGFTPADFFDVPKDTEIEFWNTFYRDYISNASVFEGVKEATMSLHEKGHRVILVSARKFRPGRGFDNESEYYEVMRKHLKDNGVYFDEIYSEDRPKTPAVDKYGIDVFIEDDPLNIKELSKVTYVLIKDASYNHDLDLPNTRAFSSWSEVVDIIGRYESRE